MGEQRAPDVAGREPGAPRGVTAVLVSHDGARWLPAVLDGLAAQSVPPDHVVAVDTGSKDESARLLAEALGADAVVQEKLNTGFPQAVRRGLEGHAACEWIWILHDDANPDPGALAALLDAASDDPEADILGPKLREWPSLSRLLEVGVTISGTGRRETGLELGEYDQGQHDEVRQVLAVNTAGMLVRRSVFEELGGFDDRMPIFGNDIDFGWRAARAGHKTLIVPKAVVFHAEAAHRGARKTALTGRHTHLAERTAALYTLLANCTAALLPVQLVRLFFGSLLRSVGFLVVRSPGQAVDELAAVLSVRPATRHASAARKARTPLAHNDARVRRLLAPRWLPYRHGLDTLSDLAAAATNQAADVAERRRAAKLDERGEPALVLTDDDDFSQDSGLVVRFLTSPIALLMTGFILVALWLCRDALGNATLSGSGFSPAPADAADLVAPARRVVAPARAGQRRGRPGVRPAAGAVGISAIRSSRGRSRPAPRPGGAVRHVGGLAVPAGRRQARRPAWGLGVAACLGLDHLRTGADRERRLGPGPVRDGRRGRPAALARPRRPRLRRPRAGPSAPRRLADRPDPRRLDGGRITRSAASIASSTPGAGALCSRPTNSTLSAGTSARRRIQYSWKCTTRFPLGASGSAMAMCVSTRSSLIGSSRTPGFHRLHRASVTAERG